MRTFLDTNILVYADDGSERIKQLIAVRTIADLMANKDAVISIQVLQEYYSSATKKLKMDVTLIYRQIEFYSLLPVLSPEPSDVLAAIDLIRIHRLSFWDAMIVRAAKLANCRVLLTEDLRHGTSIDGLKVVNPFL